MINPSYVELWRIGVIVLALTVLGEFFGHPLAGLILGLAGSLAWYLRGAAKLNHWLAGQARNDIPRRSGIWPSIYHRLRGLHNENEQRYQELSATLERHRQATRALPEAVVTLGPADEIEFVNDAALRLLGFKDPDDIGRPISNLIREPEFLRYLESADFSEALEIHSPINDKIILFIRIVPYGDVNKKLLLARDVSRLRRLEQMRRDFVANVSHEMKSPLTVIKGYVETLLDDPAARSQWHKPLSQVDQQTDRMVRIVEDLLQLSNLETGPSVACSAPIDVPALIRSIGTEAMELSGGRHEIVLSLDEELFLLGSFNELYSGFLNLVINAVRYTPAAGRIELLWCRDEAGGARFSVSDNGVGIGAEHIPRLTERFYRVDQARSRQLGGTGLGLAIAKHVLIRHDGMLSIDSELGRGSTFSCAFPLDRVVPRAAVSEIAR